MSYGKLSRVGATATAMFDLHASDTPSAEEGSGGRWTLALQL